MALIINYNKWFLNYLKGAIWKKGLGNPALKLIKIFENKIVSVSCNKTLNGLPSLLTAAINITTKKYSWFYKLFF